MTIERTGQDANVLKRGSKSEFAVIVVIAIAVPAAFQIARDEVVDRCAGDGSRIPPMAAVAAQVVLSVRGTLDGACSRGSGERLPPTGVASA